MLIFCSILVVVRNSEGEIWLMVQVFVMEVVMFVGVKVVMVDAEIFLFREQILVPKV